MSTHTLISNRRHPDADRQRIQVGHITFEYSTKNKTFALKACEAEHAKDRKPLFTGFIEKGMHKELLRLASVFRAQEGAKWRLNRANRPPFEATRLAPGQRPCRRPETRFRSPLRTPAAWLGPIRPIAPSASVPPRHSIWAPEPEIGRNRQNCTGAGTVRSRPPGRVGRCPMVLLRA